MLRFVAARDLDEQLFSAAGRSNEKMVQLLLYCGANPSKDWQGTASHMQMQGRGPSGNVLEKLSRKSEKKRHSALPAI